MNPAKKNSKTIRLSVGVNVLLVKEDGLYYSFQARNWADAARRALEENERQNAYVRDGHSKARYARCFMSAQTEGRPALEEHEFRVLRADLDADMIPEGPFVERTVTL